MKLAEQFGGKTCQLDGRAAQVMGRKLPYGIVQTLPEGPAFRFTWERVEHVMLNCGGDFRTRGCTHVQAGR